MNTHEVKAQICDVCHKMWQLGWVAANDGNVSVKLPDCECVCYVAGLAAGKWQAGDATLEVKAGAELVKITASRRLDLNFFR